MRATKHLLKKALSYDIYHPTVNNIPSATQGTFPTNQGTFQSGQGTFHAKNGISTTDLIYPKHQDKLILPNEKSEKSLFFLHGILGSKRNWRTPANVFRKLHPNFTCYAIDLRGHGESHFIDDSKIKWENNTVYNSAEDLHELIINQKINSINTPNILCAHSFGGKVALKYLEKLYLSDMELPDHTWILDSLPGPYLQVKKNRLFVLV